MNNYYYSEWDGSQEFEELDSDQLMDELGKQVFSYGNLTDALRAMQSFGINNQGRQMPNLNQLLQKLRQMKQDQLSRYNLDSMMDEIKQRLDNILDTERHGIQNKLDEAEEKARKGGGELISDIQDKLLKNVRDRAAQNLAKLDELPQDTGGRIKGLTDYDFMDDNARSQFNELLDMRKKQAMEQFGKDMVQQLKNMDPESLTRMRNMIESLNQMLEQRMRGEEPDFEGFMQQYGDFFGDNPPRSLDELIERLQRQIAQAQSLMDSLSPEIQQELQELMDSMLDNATKQEMAKMASYMERLFPSEYLQQRYPFSGDESVSYQEAMKLMETLQKMDDLEEQMEFARYDPAMDEIDNDLVKELMGEEAEKELEAARELIKLLEEAGYISKEDGRYELTPKGIRKIGHQALNNIFSQLKKDRSGEHNIHRTGMGNEFIEETKQYEFGDDFHIHIQKTVMNSLMREPSFPLKLSVDDFEVMKTEETTRSATVLILDKSLSMFMSGYFDSAKQVAVALESLIKTRFPKDSLYILTFASRAREIRERNLLFTVRGEQGTNYEDALKTARKLLSRQNCNNKEIIMITDGEPTAHLEGDLVYFGFPPSMRTLQKTMREVKACTSQRITINVFMFEHTSFLTPFITQMTKLNKGRVFFANPDNLGKYVMMDYLSNKFKNIG